MGGNSQHSGVKDVLGNDYREASALDSAVRSWDEAYQEHVLSYKKAGEEHVMFYPSVESIQVSALYPAQPTLLRYRNAHTKSVEQVLQQRLAAFRARLVRRSCPLGCTCREGA